MSHARYTLIFVLASIAICTLIGSATAQVVTTFPFQDDFEGQSPSPVGCAISVTLASPWTNATDDDLDWYVGAGGTSSGGTGPSVDQNPGNASGAFLYIESSCFFGSTVELLSPQFDISGFVDPPQVSYHYHMYGNDQGMLHTDVVEQLNSGTAVVMVAGLATLGSANFVAAHVGTIIELTSPMSVAGTYTIDAVHASNGIDLSPTPPSMGSPVVVSYVHYASHPDALTPVTDDQDLWQENSGQLSGLIGGGAEQLITVVMRGVTGPGIQSDMAIDSFSFDEHGNDDVGVISIDSPTSGAALGMEDLALTVKNFGGSTQAGFGVSVSLDGGLLLSGTVNVPVAPGATYQLVIPSFADVSAAGFHTISATTQLVGDTDPSNDGVQVTIHNTPVISTFPYLEDFENDDGFFVSGRHQQLVGARESVRRLHPGCGQRLERLGHEPHRGLQHLRVFLPRFGRLRFHRAELRSDPRVLSHFRGRDRIRPNLG